MNYNNHNYFQLYRCTLAELFTDIHPSFDLLYTYKLQLLTYLNRDYDPNPYNDTSLIVNEFEYVKSYLFINLRNIQNILLRFRI